MRVLGTLSASMAAIALLAMNAEAQKPSRELVHHDNVTLEVIAQGSGPLIVLLPSLGRDSEELDPWAAKIAAGGFRVLRPRPRGFGKSSGPMDKLTLHDLARDIAAVIEPEHDGPAIVAGHAYGHFVAKMTATDFPTLVARWCWSPPPRNTRTRKCASGWPSQPIRSGLSPKE